MKDCQTEIINNMEIFNVPSDWFVIVMAKSGCRKRNIWAAFQIDITNGNKRMDKIRSTLIKEICKGCEACEKREKI